jgi:putative transposase
MHNKTHLGWRSRGYLPHCDAAGLFQHIVFGLADAIPPQMRSLAPETFSRTLDEGHGDCTLGDPACAEIVEETLLVADAERYTLLAWCVMPNHCHVVIEQREGFPLGDIVQAWKSTSAHRINKHLTRTGRLWRREYFDRFMRDNDHLSSTIEYVEANPVTAKLVGMATDWTWSSARRR